MTSPQPVEAEPAGGRLERWKSITGIDFHVAAVLLLRSWTIVAGGVMVLAIPAFLNPQAQGYYFTFSSLLGLQIFFELGLNQVVVQLVSHELAHLTLRADGTLQGDANHLDRLRSIVALLRRWYAVASVAFLVVTTLAGLFMFSRHGTLPLRAWVGPWIALTVASAANLYFSPMLAVTEGSGHVGQVGRVRLVQSIAGYSLTWIALAAGAGLWAIPLISATGALCTALWLRGDRHLLRAYEDSLPIARERRIDWRREVFPFQWRIAVSWMSGYVLIQLFTPLIFVQVGAVEAGRLGMTLAVFTALQSVGVSWINAKTPALTALISRGEDAELNRTFFSVLLRSVLFSTLSSVVVVSAVRVLGARGVHKMDRLVDMPTMICIAVVTVANTLGFGLASYMRAHRTEPMLPVSVVGAVLTLVAAYFCSRMGTFPIMLSQAVICVMITLPWTIVLFRGFHRRHVS